MKLINWGWYLWPGLVSWLTYTNTPLAPAKQKWSSEGRRGEAGGGWADVQQNWRTLAREHRLQMII